jgi:hypothetical protein
MSISEDILAQASKDVKKPPPLPEGLYSAMVMEQPEDTTVGKKQTPAIIVQLGNFQQREVDPAKLANIDLADYGPRRLTLFKTTAALWRVKKFLDDVGIDDVDGTASLRQRLDQTPGHRVLIWVKHKMPKGGEGEWFDYIEDTAKE